MTASNKTLYLVQSDYEKTKSVIERIETIYSQNDSIVLMGDAVLHCFHDLLIKKSRIFILESEIDLLSEDIPPPHIKALSSSDFADLILDYTRCISFK